MFRDLSLESDSKWRRMNMGTRNARMFLVVFGAILGLVSLGAAPAQDSPVLLSPDDVKWMDGPPSLPDGAKMAVMCGDPKLEGPWVLRAKFPAGYKVPPHTHPSLETVTVLTGTLHASMGDTFDASKAKAMSAGGFLMLPARSPHFVFAKEETVIQVSGTGPFDVTYLNPADDPRKARK